MKRAVVLGAVLCLSALASGARAEPILWICDNQGKIGKVDVATGKVSIVGNAGVVLTDIAFDPEGNLFGVSFDAFYSLDQTSGTATLVRRLGVDLANALVFSSAGTAYVMCSGHDTLYVVDSRTGAARPIGHVGGFGSAGDLAIRAGKLYLASNTSRLVEVKLLPVGGAAVGPIGVANVYGLALGDDGLLFAVARTSIYSVDPDTGKGTFLVDYKGKGLGIAYGAAFAREATRRYDRPASANGKGS